jgi:uncharacterized protein (DUF1778 family)
MDMNIVRANKKNRTRRLNFRATERQERLIRTGAETRGVSVTDFILESACLQAEHALADKHEFVVSQKQWQAFLEALDRPPRVNPKLARLFSNPVVLPQAVQK